MRASRVLRVDTRAARSRCSAPASVVRCAFRFVVASSILRHTAPFGVIKQRSLVVTGDSSQHGAGDGAQDESAAFQQAQHAQGGAAHEQALASQHPAVSEL
ncbi:Protein of unknown function [Gryllus bimaculatus]|nr:Protein of unknown function [Gryllus bimaculatus]